MLFFLDTGFLQWDGIFPENRTEKGVLPSCHEPKYIQNNKFSLDSKSRKCRKLEADNYTKQKYIQI